MCFALLVAANAMYISSRMLGKLAIPALMAGGMYSSVGAGFLLGAKSGHHGHHGHLDLHGLHLHGHHHGEAIHVYPVEHEVPVVSHSTIVTHSHSDLHHHHGLHF
jgi:hypothetical protein